MRLSEADYAQLIAKRQPAKAARAPKASKSQRGNKFNAVKTDGCDSKKEARRMAELRLMELSGAIQNLIPQVRFTLIHPQIGPSGKKERAVCYTCDFLYIRGGKLIIEDCKSEITRALPDYVIRRKLLLQLHGLEITEV